MTVSPLDFCRDEAILAALERERQLARAYVLGGCIRRANRAFRPGTIARLYRLAKALRRRQRVARALAAYCAAAVRSEAVHRRDGWL